MLNIIQVDDLTFVNFKFKIFVHNLYDKLMIAKRLNSNIIQVQHSHQTFFIV